MSKKIKKVIKTTSDGYQVNMVDRGMNRYSYVLLKSGSIIANADRLGGALIAKTIVDKAAFEKFSLNNPNLSVYF